MGNLGNPLFARKPVKLLLEEMEGENRLRRVLGPVQLSSLGIGAIIGTGIFVLTGIAAHDKTGPALETVIGGLEKQGIGVISREALKSAPRGFDRDHPRAELLRRKGLAAWKDFGVGAWLGTAKAKIRVVDFLRAAQPLNDWLGKHAG